jgi:hypothetical protein
MTAVKNLVTADRCIAKEINQAQHVVMSPNLLTFLSFCLLCFSCHFSLGGIQLGCQFNKEAENETEQEWVPSKRVIKQEPR